RAAVERLAAPLRLCEVARRQIADAPARLVRLPACREVAEEEARDAFRRVRLAVERIDAARLNKARERFLDAAEVLQRGAEIEVRRREARREHDRAACRRLGLLGAADDAQRMAEVGLRLGIVGLELRGAAEMRRRILDLPEVEQRGAEIVVGAVMPRL